MGTLLLACVLASQSYAQTTFFKLADTTTSIPGGSGTFTDFKTPISDVDRAIFYGEGTAGQMGYYQYDGTTSTKLVDRNTAVPEGAGNFTNLSFFAYGVDTNFVFAGTDAGGMKGLFQLAGTTLTKLGNTNTAAPGSGGNFSNFLGPAVAGNSLALLADGPGSYRGAFRHSGGTFTRLVDTATPFPGGPGNLNFSGQLAFDGTAAAFFAFDSVSFTGGIFSHANNTLTSLATTNTVMPGFANRFSSFQSPPALSGGTVVFIGQDTVPTPAVRGIFAVPVGGGTLTALVTTATAIPGGTSGNFSFFNGFAYDNGALVFAANNSSGVHGLYKLQGGTLKTLLAGGGLLDGKTFTSLAINSTGFRHGIVGFRVSFTDGSKGVFAADIGQTAEAFLGITSYLSASGATVSFTGEVSRAYRLQYSTTLLLGSWTTLTNFTYTAPVSVADTSAAGQAKRFYRAVSP
ncbi:MAG: hypothetical protein B9S33_05260 [Pedosphaera sp. Tous-C6FEB]|nr:MAG: hypothetical protein B9S33_05260 [Pedosphaera sp. Tous-C6FEB]